LPDVPKVVVGLVAIARGAARSQASARVEVAMIFGPRADEGAIHCLEWSQPVRIDLSAGFGSTLAGSTSLAGL
jgi:hypothetical protein